MGGVILFAIILFVVGIAFSIIACHLIIKGVAVFADLLNNKTVVGCAWIVVGVVFVLFLIFVLMLAGG